MIKTNQILSVGCSLSVGKVREKLWTNQQPSLKRYVKCTIWYKVYVCRKCVCTKYVFACAKWESTESTSSECFFYFPCQKKVKEALKTRSSGSKITWTETFVRSKKFAKWKTTLNRGTLVCYEKLPIKTHLKNNVQSFFVCNRNPTTPHPP